MFTRDPATATIGKEILPLETSELNEYFRRKAEVELNDTPERRVEDLKLIKELIKKEECLEDFSFSDDFLLRFLRVRKFDVAKTVSSLKTYVSFKTRFPKLFTNFRFESIIKTVTYKVATMLPHRCQDGCAVLLIQLDNWDPNIFTTDELKHMYIVLLYYSTRNIMTQVNGFKVIIDVNSSKPLLHIRHCTPHNMYLFIHGSQNCVPGRYKGLHIVNNSLTFKTIWMFAKHILPEKLKNRIFFHSSNETLLDHFPKDILPVKYGGTLVHFDNTQWYRNALQPEELEAMFGGEYKDKTIVA